MLFNPHSGFAGKHAFLSPSNYHWLNYDEVKLDARFVAHTAAQRGTEIHAFAHEAIRLGIKLPATKKTVNLYVNDGIGFKMSCEVVLYYSDNVFGSADCVSFRKNKLRIHDLKTGISPVSVKQLEIYAALFCLEYKYTPFEISIELRIYQRDEIQIYDADPDSIAHIMEKIKTLDSRINELRLEAMS